MPAWVKGDATDADTALAAAAELLGAARAPVIAGLSAEVAAIRAAIHLAGRLGASLDTAGAGGTYADLGALARVGALTSTPAEAVGRADLVLVVGESPWRTPLLGRLAASKPVRGRAAGAERTLAALGAAPPGATLTVAAEEGLPIDLALLRAHARGHLAAPGPLADLAGRLASASYAVAVYDPAELGELGVETLQGLMAELGETTRGFALSLSGPDQDRAVVPVSAWLTGQAPRTGFGRHVPEHDSWRFDAARQVEAGETDAVLWLASVPAEPPGWLGRVPSVALVGQAAPDLAAVVIQVGVPGRDHGGVLWNEARAALTFQPPPAGSLGDGPPPAAEILGRLTERLMAGRLPGGASVRDLAC